MKAIITRENHINSLAGQEIFKVASGFTGQENREMFEAFLVKETPVVRELSDCHPNRVPSYRAFCLNQHAESCVVEIGEKWSDLTWRKDALTEDVVASISGPPSDLGVKSPV